jgi:sulfur carrier protein ThiS
MAEFVVTFVLRGNLMWYPEQKQKYQKVLVEKDTTIIDVIRKLNVPIEQISYILRNGQKVDACMMINEGDEVELVPIIAGG